MHKCEVNGTRSDATAPRQFWRVKFTALKPINAFTFHSQDATDTERIDSWSSDLISKKIYINIALLFIGIFNSHEIQIRRYTDNSLKTTHFVNTCPTENMSLE